MNKLDELLSDCGAVPKLVVLDLDYTIWPFYCASIQLPLRINKRKQIVDQSGSVVQLYNKIFAIISRFQRKGIPMAIASRSPARVKAEKLLQEFNIEELFLYSVIYSGCKKMHFEQLHKQSEVEYQDMLFFDDDHRNIVEVGELGVICQHVRNGLTCREIIEAIHKFRKRQYPNS